MGCIVRCLSCVLLEGEISGAKYTHLSLVTIYNISFHLSWMYLML